MKKLFLLLCMTAAVLIAGRAHAALYSVVNFNGSVSGCANPAIGDVIDVSVFGACAVGNIYTAPGLNGPISGWRYGNGKLLLNYSGAWISWISAIPTGGCPSGTELNTDTGRCETPKSRCADVADSLTTIGWKSSVYGTSPSTYWCSSSGGGCASERYTSPNCDFSITSGYDCTATYKVIDQECDFDESSDDGFCTDSTCSDKVSKPEDNTDPVDPTHNPTDPTTDVDSKGEVSTPDITPSEPDPVDPAPEVADTSEAAAAVVNLNKDVNKALNDLNIDINSSNSRIENELKLLNANDAAIKSQVAQLEETNIKIANNNKELMISLNRDVVTSINANTNAINNVAGNVGALNNNVVAIGNKVGELTESVNGMATDVGEIKESVSGMGETLDGMADDLSGIGDAIDGLANIDGEGLRQGTCFSNPQYTFCKGWYEPNYPDGFRGVFDDQFGQLTDAVTASVNNIFGNLDLSNAAPPSFCLTFWMLGASCFTDYLDLSWVFGFIRFAFMFTTVWQSRKIVFGG
ncbi:methyl-accepting chemotaxis protein [Vibrio fluvialis]|nr:methyl-accepting chemotaxis protein [Vibrio fluvialis]